MMENAGRGILARCFMTDLKRFGFLDLILLVVVFAAAGGARAWYLMDCADMGKAGAPLLVQGPGFQPVFPPDIAPMHGRKKPSDIDNLIHSLAKDRKFEAPTPLADTEEATAHVAPGYPWLAALVVGWCDGPEQGDMILRWGQAGLGALTAAFYFLFA